MPKKELLVSSPLGPDQRLDVFLSSHLRDLSRSQLQRMIQSGKVQVNGISCKSGQRLKDGDKITLDYEPVLPYKIQPENIPLDIIHEDPQFLIINKPSGMVVHPGAGVISGTLVHALLFHYPEIASVGPEMRPGLVHRLDKETSGLLIVARSSESYAHLQSQFKARTVTKTYYGLVWGKMPRQEGVIDWPLGRHVKQGERISVSTKKPKPAVTRYRIEKIYKDYSLLILMPETGRTHQLRVHLAASGHPLVGDARYGRRKKISPMVRLFLHAFRLQFVHPITGEAEDFKSPLPEDLNRFITAL